MVEWEAGISDEETLLKRDIPFNIEGQLVGAALAAFQSQGEQDSCVLPGRTSVGSSYSQLWFQGERLSLAVWCTQLCALPVTPINQETVTPMGF